MQFQIVTSFDWLSSLHVAGGPQSGLQSRLVIDPKPVLISSNTGLEWQSIEVTARLVVIRRTRIFVKAVTFMMSKPLEYGGGR